ncbi:ATP-dependent helicase [Ornithinimicrobium avium]|uniref:DNA 3'-5' helicase n=1 Tax=Ornithinimicrobium avium TaxID=2283195 RepID=A0A345NT51_9MICO|nr:ATP-dependent DNA helicase [Ornithinimicrobium avium]AXH98209.1 ATP-dependent helicase [Ornithinimicrobium avium]
MTEVDGDGSGALTWLPDPWQERVVAHRGGVLLVLGAPGTGKTTTVVRHVQQRILQDHLHPDACLVLAPTRQAAARLRTAVGRGLGRTFVEPLARTPSSLAFSVLRLAAVASGEPLPRLLSGAEQDVVLRELLSGHAAGAATAPDWPEHLGAALPTAGFRDQLRDLLMRAVEHGLEPSDLRGLASEHGRPEWDAAADVLQEYDEVTALSEPGAYDPAWICTAAADVLEDDPDLLDAVRGRLRVLVVDDAQELTASAARLVAVLRPPTADVLLVGDPDSGVLGFRGAVADRFVGLGQELHRAPKPRLWADPDAPGRSSEVPRVLLGRRYGGARLSDVVARVADRIGTTVGAAHRHVETVRPAGRAHLGEGDGGTVRVAVARSRAQEAAHVARVLRAAHLGQGVPWAEMAVVARSGAQQDSVRRALAAGGVPVRVDRAGLPVGQDPAVAPLLLAFDVVTRDPGSPWAVTPEEAVELVTSPLGAVDPVHLRRLRRRLRGEELAAGGGRAAGEVLAHVVSDAGLRATTPAQLHPDLAPLVRVGRVLDAGRAALDREPRGTAEDVLWALWEASGLATLWREQALGGGPLGARADRDLDAVLVLFGAAESYVERLPGSRPRGFLDHVRSAEVAADTLVAGARAEASVEVLTPQSSAGRRWRVVAVVGVQDGVWPDLRLRDTLLGSESLVAALRGRPVDGPEAVRAAQGQVRSDELRQFHVAVSRATELLLVSAVASTEDQPSVLLDLVDPRHRDRPPVEVPPPLTLRGLVGQLRREAVASQRVGDTARRDAAVETLLVLADEDVVGADPGRWWDVREVSSSRPVTPEGPVPVSPSRVKAYMECPLQWFLTSRGAESGDVVRADIGTLVHDVVATRPEAGIDELTAELERRWPELGLPANWVAERSRLRAREMIVRYGRYVEESRAAGRSLVGTEIGFSVTVRPDPSNDDSPAEGTRTARLRGQVDRLESDADGALVVLDLKTGGTKPAAAEIARHAQLGAYQVAVQEGAFEDLAPGAGSGGAQLVQLGTGSRPPTTQAQPPVDQDEDPGWARTMLVATATGMAGATFDARIGDACRHCSARFSCPLQPEGQER